ncbi:ATP-binding protein [Streptomyces filamentosus]|uniref:ATP-binding protein n=1 Tax=Streptomyces filamentosus TaxID=67294 RepID=A0A919BY75_STRFL|nr:ATP-binding protein [Streptomyces filamentosus]
MHQVTADEDAQLSMADTITVSGVFEGSEDIALARDLARSFLTDVQAVHGLPVSPDTMSRVQLVVSELVTNARKYAPGPCLLTLELTGAVVHVTVWDSDPTPPTLLAPDPSRIGRHGLEIVMALGQSFAIHREPVGKRITTTILLEDDPA